MSCQHRQWLSVILRFILKHLVVAIKGDLFRPPCSSLQLFCISSLVELSSFIYTHGILKFNPFFSFLVALHK